MCEQFVLLSINYGLFICNVSTILIADFGLVSRIINHLWFFHHFLKTDEGIHRAVGSINMQYILENVYELW